MYKTEPMHKNVLKYLMDLNIPPNRNGVCFNPLSRTFNSTLFGFKIKKNRTTHNKPPFRCFINIKLKDVSTEFVMERYKIRSTEKWVIKDPNEIITVKVNIDEWNVITRITLTKFKQIHPKVCKERLYLPRE